MEDFVTYEIAKKLKEKGFNEKCLYHYLDGKIIANSCSFDQNTPVTTEDLMMSCNFLVSQFNTCKSNVVVSDAPTISQVLKWLRDEKKIHISIMLFMFQEGWCFEIIQIVENPKLITTQRNSCDTYEKAAIAGIEYVLNNLI